MRLLTRKTTLFPKWKTLPFLTRAWTSITNSLPQTVKGGQLKTRNEILEIGLTTSADLLAIMKSHHLLLPEIAEAIFNSESEIIMTPSTLAILLHLGGVIQTIKDVVHGIEDVVAGKASADDAKAILRDLSDLIAGGVFKIPGLSQEQINQIVADLGKV